MEAILTQVLTTNAQVAPALVALVVFVYILWYKVGTIEIKCEEKEEKHIKCREENAIKFHGLECLILNGINDIKLQLAEKRGHEKAIENLAQTITQELRKKKED